MFNIRIFVKKFLAVSTIIAIALFCFFSCMNQDSYYDDEEDDRRNRSNRSRSSSSSCRNSGDRVTISSPRDISNKNAGEYPLSGRCDSSDREVEISVESENITVPCLGGRWNTYLDITAIVQGRNNVNISARSGGDSACTNIENYFECPQDYIPVPRLDDYTSDDFCVMEYEARSENDRSSRRDNRSYSDRYINREVYYDRDRDNRYNDEIYYEKAVSRSGGNPWVYISRKEAAQKCRNNGSGYELIDNDEWQTIARHIESVDENWSLGRAVVQDGNALNRGIGNYGEGGYYSGSGSRNSRRSSTRTTSRYSANSRWSDDNNSHFLPNGTEIFDFSGGVWELVDDDPRKLGMVEDSNEYIAEITGKNKELFGPKYNYSSINERDRTRAFAGLGYAFLSNIKDTVVRGGANERELGVFSVNVNIQEDRIRQMDRIGFRCVYHP